MLIVKNIFCVMGETPAGAMRVGLMLVWRKANPWNKKIANKQQFNFTDPFKKTTRGVINEKDNAI